MNDDYCIENDFAAQRELHVREQAMIDETRRQRIRADKAEAELELLKNIVRKMLDAQIARDGFEYVEAKELVRMIK